MNKSLPMRFVQRVSNLDGVAQYQLSLQSSMREPISQRLAFQVFHHQKVDAILLSHIVECADVGMIQAGDGACLALEALAQSGLGGKAHRAAL